jgi:hypothetical protein
VVMVISSHHTQSAKMDLSLSLSLALSVGVCVCTDLLLLLLLLLLRGRDIHARQRPLLSVTSTPMTSRWPMLEQHTKRVMLIRSLKSNPTQTHAIIGAVRVASSCRERGVHTGRSWRFQVVVP